MRQNDGTNCAVPPEAWLRDLNIFGLERNLIIIDIFMKSVIFERCFDIPIDHSTLNIDMC